MKELVCCTEFPFYPVYDEAIAGVKWEAGRAVSKLWL